MACCRITTRLARQAAAFSNNNNPLCNFHARAVWYIQQNCSAAQKGVRGTYRLILCLPNTKNIMNINTQHTRRATRQHKTTYIHSCCSSVLAKLRQFGAPAIKRKSKFESKTARRFVRRARTYIHDALFAGAHIERGLTVRQLCGQQWRRIICNLRGETLPTRRSSHLQQNRKLSIEIKFTCFVISHTYSTYTYIQRERRTKRENEQ